MLSERVDDKHIAVGKRIFRISDYRRYSAAQQVQYFDIRVLVSAEGGVDVYSAVITVIPPQHASPFGHVVLSKSYRSCDI